MPKLTMINARIRLGLMASPPWPAFALLRQPATTAHLPGHIVFILLSLTAKPSVLKRFSIRAVEGIIIAVIDERFFGKDALWATGSPVSFFERFKVALDSEFKAAQIVFNRFVFTLTNANL